MSADEQRETGRLRYGAIEGTRVSLAEDLYQGFTRRRRSRGRLPDGLGAVVQESHLTPVRHESVTHALGCVRDYGLWLAPIRLF